MEDSGRPQWPLILDVDARAQTPVFLQIAQGIAEGIDRGRLPSGYRLPGSRTLAATLGVHRNTVLAALRELQSQGYLETHPARGTFVASDLPGSVSSRPVCTPRRRSAGFRVDVLPDGAPDIEDTAKPSALVLSGGVPDLRLAPRIALGRALRRVLGRDGYLLGYGDPRGEASLRAALASMLAQHRGLSIAADDVLITRGSQMALDLVARTLLRHGDRVGVEALGYRPAWQALTRSGATLVPIPVDDEGLDVAALERLAKRQRLRAVYVTPHHQYPTTVTLQVPRRLALLELAQRYGWAVIEDDYDHEFHYEGRPLLPLAARDHRANVVYIGTLSKVVAPGLRIGYVVAPEPLHAAMVDCRRAIDRQGDRVLERALADLFEEGEIGRHIRRMRRIYRARRDAFVTALERQLGTVLQFSVPAGAMAVWARADRIDVDAWAQRARGRGVFVQTGRRFTFDGSALAALRLGFAALDERRARRALQILRETGP